MRFYSAAIVVVLAACAASNSENETIESSAVGENGTEPVLSAENRVVGLLSLPQVFGDYPCDTYTPSEISLYEGPGLSRPLGAINVVQPWTMHPTGGCEGLRVSVSINSSNSAEELPTFEYDYEMPAAIVLARHDDWFNIKLAEGTAWVSRSGNSRFIPLEELLVNNVTYVAMPDGSGLSTAPGGADRSIGVDLLTTYRSVQVFETRSVNGDLWLRVAVHSHSPCESTDEPASVAEGWLPAHTAAGEPIVWFYSRGC